LFYLPPYLLDFNPIEQAFAKLKALLRKAATRSVDALWTAIGSCLERFAPYECAITLTTQVMDDSCENASATVYTPKGMFSRYTFFPKNPDLMSVDTTIIQFWNSGLLPVVRAKHKKNTPSLCSREGISAM